MELAIGLLFLCIFFGMIPAILFIDCWLPLLGAIFKGDSSQLKWDILSSGICKDKRSKWMPKPKVKPIWSMNPEEREKEQNRQEYKDREKRPGIIESILGPPQPYHPQPYHPPNHPQPYQPLKPRTEMDDMTEELFRELD